MGNQARVADEATVVSTSTRNFPNRMGAGSKVFLASAELASVCSVLGRIPNFEEYQSHMAKIATQSDETYRYMNFNEMPEFELKAAARS